MRSNITGGNSPAIVARRHGAVRGFTVVEVLMAAVILSVGFVGLIQSLTIGSEEMDTARKQQVAAQIISAEIERLRSGDWSVIANLPSTASITINGAGVINGDPTRFALSNYTSSGGDDNSALSKLGRGFTCSLASTRLRPVAATASTVTFVKLVYTVSWTGNTGHTFSRTTETYLGKNGLHLSYQKS